ncbi:LysR family transcriptional regulator [Hahella sp. NBU794]|uniref:LysR family transcriptional regulator n=1 Tax=Hahella sp. NBU794 TaxID=3422590 RepID=UPI003D6E6A93
MKQAIVLDALAHFDLVARHGGFSRAEQASGKPKATLSRQVRGLEDQLGIRLINRDSRAFALSEEGQWLHERTRDLLADLNEAVTALTHDRAPARGRLRVSCPMMFGHMVMGRRAAEFAQAYPEIQLEVTVEEREVDLIEEGYDVVIRVNPRPDSQLVGRCILRNVQHLVAPAGLSQPRDETVPIPAVTRSSTPDERTLRVLDGQIERAYLLRSALRLPSPLMQRDAVLTGGLVAILPYALIAQDLANGTLVDWGRLPTPPVEVWALHASRRLTSARIKAFIDFLSDQAALPPPG